MHGYLQILQRYVRTLDTLGIVRDWIRRIDNKQSRTSAEREASPYISPSIDLSSCRTTRFIISGASAERRGKENGRERS